MEFQIHISNFQIKMNFQNSRCATMETQIQIYSLNINISKSPFVNRL